MIHRGLRFESDDRLTAHPYAYREILTITVLSVPVKLLKEGEGHMVTVELKTGEVYRGLLVESEDTMNLHLSEGARWIGFH